VKPTSYRLAILFAIVAAVAAAGSRAFSQTAIDGGGQPGLWRDSEGNYWCGGVCSPGQWCCSINHP
jgi:hypothetical protein